MFLNESLIKQSVKWNGVLWKLHQHDLNQLIMTCQVFPYLTSLFIFHVIYFCCSCNFFMLLFISVNDIPSLLILNIKFLLPESRKKYDLLGKLYIKFQVPEIMPYTIPPGTRNVFLILDISECSKYIQHMNFLIHLLLQLNVKVYVV